MPALTYSDGAHRYRLDGRYVPNVTTILNAGLPKPALVKWAPQVVADHVVAHLEDITREVTVNGPGPTAAALAKLPDAKKDKAAAQGTAVHDLAEMVIHGQRVDVPPEIADRVRGYAEFLDSFGVEPLLTERMVANRATWYAGRFDLLADIGGVRWLLDLKTSRGVYGDTSLQLAAYAGAEFYVGEDGAEYPMPHIERLGVVHITDQGSDLYPMGTWPDPDAWAEFLACKQLHRGASRRRRLDGYDREPIGPADLDPAPLLSFGGVS